MKTGLDDGPPLPRHVVNAWKKPRAQALVASGVTLRDAAKELGVSHETIRDWTRGVSGACRRVVKP